MMIPIYSLIKSSPCGIGGRTAFAPSSLVLLLSMSILQIIVRILNGVSVQVQSVFCAKPIFNVNIMEHIVVCTPSL